MRTLALRLALGLLVGCSSPPSEVTTETSTITDSSPTTTGSPTSTQGDTTAGSASATSASTGEEVCPPTPPEDGGYDPCPGVCGGGGQCFNDGAEYAVCTRGCFMDCNCWPAPAGDGDAPVRCSSELLESTSVCVLDCSGGESCPRGMFCVADLGICAHPYPGSETTEPESSSSSDGSTTDTGSTTSDPSTTTSGGSTDTGTTDTGTTDGTTDMGSTSGTTDGGTGTGTSGTGTSGTGTSGTGTT